MRKNTLVMIAIILFTLLTVGCVFSGSGNPDPDTIVPDREVLVENLKASGYTITTLSTVEGSNLTVDRVLAQNGDKFIDIVYGLSSKDASTLFETFCALYPDDYYILARNGNYVYCVSDKSTFSNAGFTSTDNVGIQYIHD